MILLESESTKVWLKPKGAELKSLVNIQTGIEHMWDANPYYWGKTSPILFPIVGALKEDTYYFKRKKYTLPRHGFARDMMFQTESKSKTEVVFLLRSNQETRVVYPFDFELRVRYTLKDNCLKTQYSVKNTGDETMYFSIGAHPAFAVPFNSIGGYGQYVLQFNNDEKLNRWFITPAGLISTSTKEIELSYRQLALFKELFHDDALVLKDLKSDEITIKTILADNSLKFSFKDFPYFGIWAAKNAPFVCLEPWCGIADDENTHQEITEKEGINALPSGASFERAWSAEIN